MFDARRTGHSMQFEAPDSPVLRWSRALPVTANVRNSPVIAVNGDIYVAAADRIYRLNPATGVIIDTYVLPQATYALASPTLRDGGTVIVTAGTHLLMLTPDLQLVWDTDLGSALVSTPIVDPNGLIYVVSATHLHQVGVDGVEDWREPAANNADTPSHPAVGINGRIYFTAADHKVYAIDPDRPAGSRQVFATVPTGVPGGELANPVNGSVVISEIANIYTAMGDTVYGLSVAGTTVFTRDLNTNMRTGLAIHNTGYVCCNPEEFVWAAPQGNTQLVKLNIDLTPNDVTNSNVSKHTGARTATVVFDRNGDGFIGTDNARFFAFQQNGNDKWTYTVGGLGDIDGAAALGNDIIVFGDSNGRIYLLEE
jgi:outer membrane protein assembly factor BamB